MRAELPTRLVILGAAGRMGRVLLGSALADPDVEVVGAVDAPGSREIGQDVGALVGVGERGVKLSADLSAVIDRADATVEFTIPAATVDHLEISLARRKPAVVGTTGLDPAQLERVREIAREIPLFMAPNMSLGVNVLLKVLPIIAEALGSTYDVEVIEAHHHGKKDAPSGTALRLAEVVAEALGTTLPERAVYGRQGIQPREAGEIGMHAIRAGAIVGDHTILFANEGEQIEVVHRAYSRQTFALGALRAAKWIAKQPHGFYSMQDLLG